MHASSLSGLPVALVILLLSTPAAAQSPATFVSANGVNNPNCSPTAPCAEISAAVPVTEDRGEIHVIGPYTSASVNPLGKSLIGDGSVTIGATALGAGFVGSSFEDHPLTLRGIVINQRGSEGPSASDGIGFGGGKGLIVEDCVVRNGADGDGIDFRSSTRSELYVSNCSFISTGRAGIRIRAFADGDLTVVIENVRIEDTRDGIVADGTASGARVRVVVRNALISGGIGNGIVARGNAVVRISDSTITGMGRGLLADGGQIVSVGGNIVLGNTANGAFTSTVEPE